MGWIPEPGSGGGVTDHGDLDGLGDDDHTQYLNETRHNALAHSHPTYATTIGNGASTEFQVNHNLSTGFLLVQLWDVTGALPVLATDDADSIEVVNNDAIRVTFSVAPAVNSYRVSIVGVEGAVDPPEPGQILVSRTFGTTGDKIVSGAVAAGGIRTYSIWAYQTGLGGSSGGRLWAKRPGELQLYQRPNNANHFSFNADFSSTNAQWSFTKPPMNSWHHVVIVYDHSSSANAPTAYVDGLPVSVSETVGPSGTSSEGDGAFYVGNIDTPDRVWEGRLAQFAVWDRELTAGEIAQLAAGVSPLDVQAADLLLYYPMTGDSPEPDMSGNDNPGTVSGTGTDASYPFMIPDGVSLVSPSAIYSWWSVPPSAEYPTDQVAISGVERNGASVIRTTEGDRIELLGSIDRDDHQHAAILIPDDDVPIVAYARHNDDTSVRYRKGSTIGDITSLGSEATITASGNVTYTQLWRNGDDVWLLSRIGSTDWAFWKSADYGDTWGSQTLLLDESDQSYITSVQVGSMVRCAVAFNPAEADNRVWYFEIDLATGAITKADGTSIGNLDGTNLPLTVSDLDLAYTGAQNRTRLFAVSDRSSGPEIAVANWPSTDTDAGSYVYVEWDGSQWNAESVVAAGTRFGYTAAANYLGGAAFPSGTPGGVIYLAREDSGEWFVEKWEDDGGWAKAETIATSTGHPLIRPWPVGDKLTFAAVSTYADYDTWTGGNTYIVDPT